MPSKKKRYRKVLLIKGACVLFISIIILSGIAIYLFISRELSSNNKNSFKAQEYTLKSNLIMSETTLENGQNARINPIPHEQNNLHVNNDTVKNDNKEKRAKIAKDNKLDIIYKLECKEPTLKKSIKKNIDKEEVFSTDGKYKDGVFSQHDSKRIIPLDELTINPKLIVDSIGFPKGTAYIKLKLDDKEYSLYMKDNFALYAVKRMKTKNMSKLLAINLTVSGSEIFLKSLSKDGLPLWLIDTDPSRIIRYSQKYSITRLFIHSGEVDINLLTKVSDITMLKIKSSKLLNSDMLNNLSPAINSLSLNNCSGITKLELSKFIKARPEVKIIQTKLFRTSQ